MNKKTFTLALVFLLVTIAWLGVNIYWALNRQNNAFDMVVALLFVAAGIGMVYNECKNAGTSTRSTGTRFRSLCMRQTGFRRYWLSPRPDDPRSAPASEKEIFSKRGLI